MAPKVPESLGDAWQELYTAALIELDKDKMKFLIEDAERAIAIRYMNLDFFRDSDEVERLAAAKRGLVILRRECERPAA